MATGKDIKEDLVHTKEDIKSWAKAQGAQMEKDGREVVDALAKKAEEVKDDLSKQTDEVSDKAYERMKEFEEEHPSLFKSFWTNEPLSCTCE